MPSPGIGRSPPTSRSRLEANPTSVEADRFRGYRAAGVNRVSLGVQSLENDALKFLGRLHSAEEALAAIAIARANFPRLSFDLIYARPGQAPAAWRAELTRALAEDSEHLSLYQLTIEDDTPFAALHRNGRLENSGRGRSARALGRDSGSLRSARIARLRNFQSCAGGRRVPPQPRLLALWRLCGRRPRGAWQDWRRKNPPRHHDRAPSGKMARARRGEGTRTHRRRSAPARRTGRRIAVDGPAAAGGHSARAICGARRPRSRFRAHRGAGGGRSGRDSRRPAYASPPAASPCSTRSSPISQCDAL